MTKEMYATPEMDVVEFGQEDVYCDVIGASTDNTDKGDGDWGEE